MRAIPTMNQSLTLAVVLAGALTFSGCATKKYVRNTVSPVDARVAQVEKTSAQHTSSIGDLENSVSRTDERAQEANKNALAAGQAAERANQTATTAGQRADEARNMAQQNTAKIGDLQTDLHNSIENIDNFKLVTNDAVLFRFNSADLSKEAKAKLDQLAQNMTGMRRYVVEIEGYTDRSGSRQYNLALSQRRADAVIRYLMTKHNVPLRNIHVIGLGAETPISMASNTPAPTDTNTGTANRTTTRMSRKESRRVEIKLFAPEHANPSSPMQSRANPGD